MALRQFRPQDLTSKPHPPSSGHAAARWCSAPGYTLGETNPSWDFSYAAPVPETPTPEVPSTESPADSIDGVTVNTGGSESNGLVGLGAALALIGAVTAAGIRRKQS